MMVSRYFALAALLVSTGAMAQIDSAQRMALDRFADTLWSGCRQLPDAAACIAELNARLYPDGNAETKDYEWLARVRAGEVPGPSQEIHAPAGVDTWPPERVELAYRAIDAWLGRRLRDPYSVRAYALSPLHACRVSPGQEGVCACARYNAKNANGAYVGVKRVLARFTSAGDLIGVDEDARTERLCEPLPLTARPPEHIADAAERTSD